VTAILEGAFFPASTKLAAMGHQGEEGPADEMQCAKAEARAKATLFRRDDFRGPEGPHPRLNMLRKMRQRRHFERSEKSLLRKTGKKKDFSSQRFSKWRVAVFFP
jgi:hypothetical protein